ncbi:MAG: hypothetical protein KAT91_02020 [Candidatus Aenigmarchaeota archaeon]|nr:hypothetical protein [Candidatus Aenigmarchaeota archaeon]
MPHCIAGVFDDIEKNMIRMTLNGGIDPFTREYLQIKETIKANGYLAKYSEKFKNGNIYKKIEICTKTTKTEHIATLWLKNEDLKTTTNTLYMEIKEEKCQQKMEEVIGILSKEYDVIINSNFSDKPKIQISQ